MQLSNEKDKTDEPFYLERIDRMREYLDGALQLSQY